MNLRRLIRVYQEMDLPRPLAEEATPAANGVGVFITPQSIVSFPAASGAVTAIDFVLKKIFTVLAGNDLVTLLIAFFIGVILYLSSINKKMDTRELTIHFMLAIVNSFFLAASALGLNSLSK